MKPATFIIRQEAKRSFGLLLPTQVAALARQRAPCSAARRRPARRREGTGAGLLALGQVRLVGAGVRGPHQVEHGQPDQLRRALPPANACRPLWSRARSTRWPASTLLSVNRCSGPGAPPTCCCRPAPAPSMARSGPCSNDGIQDWPTMTQPARVRPPRREYLILPHGPFQRTIHRLGAVSQRVGIELVSRAASDNVSDKRAFQV